MVLASCRRIHHREQFYCRVFALDWAFFLDAVIQKNSADIAMTGSAAATSAGILCDIPHRQNLPTSDGIANLGFRDVQTSTDHRAGRSLQGRTCCFRFFMVQVCGFPNHGGRVFCERQSEMPFHTARNIETRSQ